MNWRDVLVSWDFALSVAGGVITWFVMPPMASNGLAKELYGAGISVLSIVFAVFFTALAVIITSGADDFVKFLREINIYDGIVHTFRFTLVLLFLALMASVVLFAFTAISIERGYISQWRGLTAGFAFLSLYALLAVMWSTHDALEYAKRRIEFSDWKDRQRAGTEPPPNS